ncbi:substrate-binding domain-containing protein [Bdellovibrio sp. HCB288]|uniref:substrate-binding domain-containing protein n=1 Tax=Bdellovibrio sp. HCB288 TaxID=3394355 RepID=UPI0039B42427
MRFLRLCIVLILIASPAWGRTIKVHVFYWNDKIEAQVAMRAGLEQEFEKHNASSSELKIELVPYVAGDGREGILNQINQLEEAFPKKPDAMIIQPPDLATASKALQEANAAKIPVFSFDQYILLGNLTSYITSDNYQAGWDNGIYIASLIPKEQEIKIVLVEYLRVSAVINRVDGFFDALRSKGRKFTVLKRYEAITPDSGKVAAQEILRDFPQKKSVDVIFTVNDGAGITIADTLWSKGRKEVLHATVDGDPKAIENIRRKRLTVIDSSQYCAEIGRETARQVINHFEEKAVNARVLIPTYPVTIKSLSGFNGWLGTPTVSIHASDFRMPSSETPSLNSKERERLPAIKIGIAPYCPYLCEKGPKRWTGYLNDILTSVAKENDIKIQIVSLTDTELPKALMAKTVDYIILPSYLVRYEPNFQAVGPKLGISFTGALFTPGVRIRVVDQDSLTDMRIAFARLGQETELKLNPAEFKKSTKIEGHDVADRMIKTIIERRVDLALGDYNVLRYTLLRRQHLNLELQPTSLTGFNSLSLVIVPENKYPLELQDLLNTWMEKARSNGQLEQILRKYNLLDWKYYR